MIIITSFLTSETKSRCIQYGATNYLTKPLEMETLKIALRGLARLNKKYALTVHNLQMFYWEKDSQFPGFFYK